MTDREPDAPPTRRSLGLAWALLLTAVLWHGLHPLSDPDLWWHIRLGEQLWATGSVLPTDPFSQLGGPWPYKDAGFALLANALWATGGASAIVLAKAAGFVGLTALLWRMLRHGRSLPPALASLAVAVAVSGTAYRFTERAASVSLLIVAAVLVLIERDRQGSHGLVWVVGLTIVGANVHRGVLVIPVLMTTYAVVCAAEAWSGRETHASTRAKRNGLIAVGTALACLATPFTTALVHSSVGLMGEHTAVLSEWAPVSVALAWALTPSSLLIAVGVALAGIYLAARVRPVPLWDLALAAMALALGLSSMRQLPYLALLGIGPLARAVAPWTGWIRRVGGLLAIAGCATVFASAVRGPLPPPSLGLAPAHFPERGVAFVQGLPPNERLRGRLFNEFGYGGYLIFHLWPDVRVFVDGRTDLVYPPQHVATALEALVDPSVFTGEAERSGLQWVFIDNAPHARARAHFDANPDWTLVHASRRALLYVRRDGDNAALASRLGYRLLWAHDLDGSIARAAAAGRGRDAVEELRRMVSEDPDNVYAVGALARLSTRLDVPLE